MKSLYVLRQERLRAILKEARLAKGLKQQVLCKRLKRHRMFVSSVLARGTSYGNPPPPIDFEPFLSVEIHDQLRSEDLYISGI